MECRACFGEFELDEANAALLRGGTPVRIHPKPLAMLIHLLRNRERVVSKEELLAALWPGISVSDQAFWSALRDLRRALGESEGEPRTVQTLRGRGFRFMADVVRADPAAEDSVRSPSAPPPATDFVDRDDAMVVLRTSLDCTAAGETRVSFVAGAAGMGKTRLAFELEREARNRGFEVRLGRCFDREGAAPFWPWLQVLRGLLASERTAATARQLHAALPELSWIGGADVLPGQAPQDADLDRAEVRFRFFDAVGVFLQRVSEAYPLLICIDDLHWADEGSLLLLEFAIASLHGARIHLLGAFRDPPRPSRTLSRMLASAARHPFAERIDLRGLGREGVGALLARAGGKAAAPAVIDAVIASTGGNPLFVTELAKLATQGQLDVGGLGQELPVPARVRDVLRWQFTRLSDSCQRVLQLLSVVGSELDLAALVRAVGTPRRAVLATLSEAEAAGLVIATREHMRFVFVHDLVRESIYRDLSIAIRTHLHRLIADALELEADKHSGTDAAQIAYHYALGAPDGVADKAVHWNRLAAEQANARMAYEDAVAHYDCSLRALPLLGACDPKLACELRIAQAEAAWGTLEDFATVQQRFVAAADAARTAGDVELLARAALGRSGRRSSYGDFRDISVIDQVDVALLSEADAMLAPVETETRALVLARLALANIEGREFHLSDALSQEAVRIAEKLGGQETLAETLRYRHEVLSGPRFARERLALARRILAIARQVRSRPLELDALVFESRDCFELIEATQAGRAGEAATALAASMKHPGAMFRAGHRAVIQDTLAGRLADAERHAREFYVRDASRHIGAAGTFDVQMVMIAMLRGDHARAIATLESSATRYPRSLWGESALARSYALSGQHEEAALRLRVAAREGYRKFDDHHTCLGGFLNFAEVCAELGDARRAADLYERMLPFENLLAVPFMSTIWQDSMAHGLGVLATVLERWECAGRHFERALASAKALGSPTLAATTLERHGGMLLRRGRYADRAAGRALVERAAEIAERVGMRDVLRRCDRSQRMVSRNGAARPA